MDLGLKGKKAIVTGGSLGIGKAIARELAREGADVAIVSRTKDVLEAAAGEIAAETGRRVIAIPADVTSRSQVDGMVAQAAAQLGGLHILVNSGSPPGGSPSATGPIEGLVDEDLLHDFNVKYVGALRCARAAIPFMKEQKWGRIIGRFGITVNCVHPGITRTERTPRLLAARAKELGVDVAEVEKLDYVPDSPRGNAICRMVDASEVAYVTTFLCSDKAWAITGELIVASGGQGRGVYY